MKVKQFDKPTCRMVGNEIEKALQEVGARLGVSIRYGGGQLDDTHFTCRLRIELAEGEAKEEAERREFMRYCGAFNLGAGDYGAEFTSRGRRFKLVGFALSRSKYPLRCVDVIDGTTMFFTESVLPKIKQQVR